MNLDNADNKAQPSSSSSGQRAASAIRYSDQEQTSSDFKCLEFPYGFLAIADEPMLLVNRSLVVCGANQAFFQYFDIDQDHTIGYSLSSIGNGAWNKPELSGALKQLPVKGTLHHFAVDYNATTIGHKQLYINAYCFDWDQINSPAILINIIAQDQQRQKDNETQQNDVVERTLSHQAKDEFFGLVGHELKTPVTSIKAYAEILSEILKVKKDESVLQLVSKMEKQVDRLNRLISYLLDVNRLMNGQLEFSMDLFSFNDLVNEICNRIEQSENRNPIIRNLDRDQIIKGDRERIGQVIFSLLSNAIKYSSQTAEVIIQTEITDRQIAVKVVDHGIGIPADEQGKVFNRFFRASETSNTYPGLGLGLYMSSQIVKHHGGAMGVKSTLGKGSEFYFSLPVA